MWLWQQPSVRKRHAFFLKLGIGIALIHLVLLYLLFFSYNHGSRDVTLILRHALPGAPVKFVSISDKRLGTQKVAPRAAAKIGKNKKGTGIAAAKQSAKQAAQKTKAQTTIKNTAIKKETPKTKPAPKKAAAKSTAKKAVAAKVPEKKEEPQKEKPLADKKPLVEEKMSEKVPEQVLEQDAVQEEQELVVAFGAWGTIEQEEVAALYKELSENWRPPAGIAEDCECTMKVHVGWDQSILDLETIKPSGVLVYDVSIRSALQKITLPLWTRGKNLTITFRQ